MKYIEAEKQIKALSSKYESDFDARDFNVYYKNTLIAWVKKDRRYSLLNYENFFSKIPFSNKLYIILAELAATPIDERVEEKKHYVKIFDGSLGYLNIKALTNKVIVDSQEDTGGFKTKFTDKEIEQLKQRKDIPLDWSKVHFEEAE